MDTEHIENATRKPAYNSICLQSDIFEINTDKLQGNKSFLVAEPSNKISSLESDQESTKQIA